MNPLIELLKKEQCAVTFWPMDQTKHFEINVRNGVNEIQWRIAGHENNNLETIVGAMIAELRGSND